VTAPRAALRHRLDGPQGMTLLGFLTPLGALLALSRSRPDWAPRLSWEPRADNAVPDAPVLHVQRPVAPDDIVDGIWEALETSLPLAPLNAMDANLVMSPEELRRAMATLDGDPRAAALASALATDGALRNRKSGDKTPALTSALATGGGKLYFLWSSGSGRSKTLGILEENDEVTREDVKRALFGPWTYENKCPPFYWDPADIRLHADRAKAPSDEKRHATERGANRLAFEGLALLPMTWTGDQACVTRVPRILVRWPLWTAPASAEAVRSLLWHRALALQTDRDADALPRMGVAAVVECAQIRYGRNSAYAAFGAASAVWVAGPVEAAPAPVGRTL
jgi:hypothetical protein